MAGQPSGILLSFCNCLVTALVGGNDDGWSPRLRGVAVVVAFGLLGDVELRVDGRLVDLGHARQRCVLAVLLVEVNRPVTVDALVERVWADRPPQRAVGAVHNYVSRLRRVLASTDDVVIARRSGGYVLVVDAVAIDLHLFQRLVGEAQQTDDEQDALVMYEQALGLWRGEAFAALDTPWLATIRDTLDRQRLAAELDRNDLALGLGQHARLLAELAANAARHPFDERLTGQLMLALYRDGRQADALAQYQQMRRRLADELGADPGAALRHLHHQILTAAGSLGPPASGAARLRSGPALSAMPRQLPAAPGSFAGRAHHLAQLDALLKPAAGQPTGAVICVLSGTAGVGKTALALRWAHGAAEAFPDGQLYVNLRGFDPAGSATPPGEVVRGFLEALQVPPQRIPASVDAQAALYRSQLADKRVLVVLDNARDADQVRPLIPGSAGCRVVVTSRNQLTGLVATGAVQLVTLDLLTPVEGLELLASRVGAERVAAEPEAVNDLVALCVRLPLALTVVAGRAAAHPDFPLRALADELGHAGDRLDVLADPDPSVDVRAVLSWSYRALTVHAARLFRLLALHPGPDIAVPAAASLAGLPRSRIQPLLAELSRAHLIEERSPGRYSFHDLLRAYATQLAHRRDSDDERHTATHRLLDHYLHTGSAAVSLLNPTIDMITLAPPRAGVTVDEFTDHRQATTWFNTERAALSAAIGRAADAGFDTHTWQLAWTFTSPLEGSGRWHDLATVQHTALAAARRLADPDGQARAHRQLGRAYMELGQLDEADAHLRDALDLFTATGDHVGQARSYLSLAWVFELGDRYQEAIDHADQALELFRAGRHRAGQARALTALGQCKAKLGDHQQALAHCQRALDLHRHLGDISGEAYAWHAVGYANFHLGHYLDAASCYERSLRLWRQHADRFNEAETLARLGDAHAAAGHPDQAHDAWQHALVILDQQHRHSLADEVRTKLHQPNTALGD